MNPLFTTTRSVLAAVAACAIGLSGCATPVEVKTTSKKQIELIDALDRAAAALESALADFHRNNQQLIRNQGRIAIARQSVDLAVKNAGGGENVTADELFATHENSVRPWIDYAFEEAAVVKRIEEARADLAATEDPLEKLAIKDELTELERERAKLASKPKDIADLESIFADELEQESVAIESLGKQFRALRAQIAAMKAAQTRIDTWISTDVTVTRDQVDELTESFRAAHDKFAGGTP